MRANEYICIRGETCSRGETYSKNKWTNKLWVY